MLTKVLRVTPEPAALESFENLLEQKFLSLTPEPLNQKPWGWAQRPVF